MNETKLKTQFPPCVQLSWVFTKYKTEYLPENLNLQALNCNNSKNCLYYIAGYIILSITKNTKICNNCIKYNALKRIPGNHITY